MVGGCLGQYFSTQEKAPSSALNPSITSNPYSHSFPISLLIWLCSTRMDEEACGKTEKSVVVLEGGATFRAQEGNPKGRETEP